MSTADQATLWTTQEHADVHGWGEADWVAFCEDPNFTRGWIVAFAVRDYAPGFHEMLGVFVQLIADDQILMVGPQLAAGPLVYVPAQTPGWTFRAVERR